jgi:F-type H+-transporting ATPase subunit b
VNINATMIGQSVSVLDFCTVFCMKFVWPPVIAALHERQKKIADGLDAAHEQLATWSWPKIKRVSNCAKLRLRQLKSLSKPRNAVLRLLKRLLNKPRIDADRVKVQAQAEIEQELNGVKDALRAQLGALAVEGAEKILGATIDQNAHAELVNKLAAEI